MSDDSRDLEAWLARIPQPSPREALAEVLAARQAAAEALPVPTTIPMPDYPYPLRHPRAGTVRFACPLACGWHHDENPVLEDAATPLVVPLDPRLLEAALNERAEARSAAFRQRVETAIERHFDQAHPGR